MVEMLKRYTEINAELTDLEGNIYPQRMNFWSHLKLRRRPQLIGHSKHKDDSNSHSLCSYRAKIRYGGSWESPPLAAAAILAPTLIMQMCNDGFLRFSWKSTQCFIWYLLTNKSHLQTTNTLTWLDSESRCESQTRCKLTIKCHGNLIKTKTGKNLKDLRGFSW